MRTEDIRRAVTPLYIIFVGALVCLFDFKFSETTNGEGWQFDVINDLVGMVLITIGVGKLAGIPVSPGYRTAMMVVLVVSIVGCVDALQDHFIYPKPAVLGALFTLLAMAYLAAILVFCWAMRGFCRTAGLERAAKSWLVTFILFLVIYAIPLGLFYLISLGAMVTGESFHFDLGLLGLLLLVVFVIPIIHFLVSTIRMARAARDREADPDSDLAPLPSAGPAPAGEERLP